MKDRPDPLQSLIQDWQVVGPFDNVDWKGFDTAYGPEQDATKAAYPGMKGQEVKWQRILAAGKPALGPGLVELRARFGVDENACAYALTRIKSDRDRAVTLYTGSDDTISVWVNGKPVLAKKVFRAAAPDSDRVDVQLKKGKNTVLVKVCQGSGGWGFGLRVGDEYGMPITDGGMEYGLGAAPAM